MPRAPRSTSGGASSRNCRSSARRCLHRSSCGSTVTASSLTDESVDRIVCFDAFHHVPNPAEVIGEFGRVVETRRHRRVQRARPPAFADPAVAVPDAEPPGPRKRHQRGRRSLRLPVPPASPTLPSAWSSDMRMSLADHRTLLGERRRRRVAQFALEPHVQRDAQSGDLLPAQGPVRARQPQSHRARPPDGHRSGRVRRGRVAAASIDGRLTQHRRRAVAPSEQRDLRDRAHRLAPVRRARTVDVDRLFAAPSDGVRRAARGVHLRRSKCICPGPGRFELVFDLVAEGVSWFENLGIGSRTGYGSRAAHA